MSIMLLPKILGCVWILCLLSPEIHGQCSKPDLSDNVVLVGATFEEGSSEKLSCVPGYAPATGLPRVTCQGGTWNPNPQDFTCKIKSCSNPGDLRNGRYDQTGGIDFGSTVTAICNEGYQLFGESRRSCLADGTWDGQEPRCEAVKCARPPSIENGQLESPPEEHYDHGSVVRYVCNDDYTLFGERDSICSKNGDWTEAPRCKKVQCSRPVIPNATRVQGGSGPYGYKSTLTYQCNKGFEMVSGEARIVCMENGWSVMPKCEAVQPAKTTPRTPVKETTTSKAVGCPQPGNTNAIIYEGAGGPYVPGAIIKYKCTHWFWDQLVGSPQLKCGPDGQWSNEPPTCEVRSWWWLWIIGIAVVVVVVVLCIVCWCYKKKSKEVHYDAGVVELNSRPASQ